MCFKLRHIFCKDYRFQSNLKTKCWFSVSSGNSDTTSHTNTFELYGHNKTDPNVGHGSDDTRSYGTYDKSMDDFSDDYIREYEVCRNLLAFLSSCQMIPISLMTYLRCIVLKRKNILLTLKRKLHPCPSV